MLKLFLNAKFLPFCSCLIREGGGLKNPDFWQTLYVNNPEVAVTKQIGDFAILKHFRAKIANSYTTFKVKVIILL